MTIQTTTAGGRRRKTPLLTIGRLRELRGMNDKQIIDWSHKQMKLKRGDRRKGCRKHSIVYYKKIINILTK